MADANKRINLAAPLLSVRRHGGGVGGRDETTGTGLQTYKSDATSEPPGNTSAVPFRWEHCPGHPKSVRTRRPPPPPPIPLTIVDVDEHEPSRAVTQNPAAAIVAPECARGESRRSDALSRDDVSCVTVHCSATGLSDAATAGAVSSGPRPCARGTGSVMMDRFLPAAHAVAAGSPPNAFRKAGSAARAAVALGARAAGADRLPAQRPVPLQHIAAAYHLPPLPPTPSGKNDDDDDDAYSDAHSTAGFASKRCGLLPTRCVKSALLLSWVPRRGAGRPFQSNGGGSRREKKPLLPHAGDDHGMVSQQSWEEVYIKSLLRSGSAGGLMGPAAVASELDRTVRELYKRRVGGRAVRPKASHLGLLLVLDRSNEACGHGSPARNLYSRAGDAALLLKKATTNAEEQQLGRERDAAADNADAGGGGGYGFPLLLEDKEAIAGREMALSLLPLPLQSPTESWLSRALPSVSTRPPATSFLGLHVQPKKRAPLPWCSIDSSRDVHATANSRARSTEMMEPIMIVQPTVSEWSFCSK